jgi:hypothetical protein
MNASYLPELKESDASGAIAKIYEEIRIYSGVPYVSTLQRYLATMPGVLEFGWAFVRPAMMSGEAPEAAWLAAGDALPPALPPLSSAMLRKMGIEAADLEVIRNIAANFARVSPVNVITGAMLEPLVSGAALPDGEGFDYDDDDWDPPEMLAAMPPLPAMDSMSDGLRATFETLMVPIDSQPFLPALYRQFAQWPDFATYLAGIIPARREDPAVIEAETRAIDGIVEAGHSLYDFLLPPTLPAPDYQTAALIKEAIGRYRTTSADMICTGQSLLAALPKTI